MTSYHVRNKHALDRHGVEEEHETAEVLYERRALRLAIGVLALIIGAGLVLDAVITILNRWVE